MIARAEDRPCFRVGSPDKSKDLQEGTAWIMVCPYQGELARSGQPTPCRLSRQLNLYLKTNIKFVRVVRVATVSVQTLRTL